MPAAAGVTERRIAAAHVNLLIQINFSGTGPSQSLGARSAIRVPTQGSSIMKRFGRTAAALLAASLVAVLAPLGASAGAGDLEVRMRTIGVLPTGESGGVQPAFPGGSLSAGNAVVPEIDLTWFVTDNIGLELIAATTRHRSGDRAHWPAWTMPPASGCCRRR